MSIFPETYKKAISMINDPIEMPCEEGSMSVVPTNKAKEAVGVMQEEVARLEQQLAKANERIEVLEKNSKDHFIQFAKSNNAVDGKSALFIHALGVAFDKEQLRKEQS